MPKQYHKGRFTIVRAPFHLLFPFHQNHRALRLHQRQMHGERTVTSTSRSAVLVPPHPLRLRYQNHRASRRIRPKALYSNRNPMKVGLESVRCLHPNQHHPQKRVHGSRRRYRARTCRRVLMDIAQVQPPKARKVSKRHWSDDSQLCPELPRVAVPARDQRRRRPPLAPFTPYLPFRR
jgi:hypothetical protein